MSNKKPVRIEGIKEISFAILDWLHSGETVFIEDKTAGLIAGNPSRADGEAGWLSRGFNLSDLRKETGRENYEKDDPLILDALDSLATKGEILIIKMELRRYDDSGDCFFKVIYGASVRETFYPYTFPTLRERVWTNKENSKAFRKSVILRPSTYWTELRTSRDKDLSRRLGRIDLELESKLHREDLDDEVKMKRAIYKIAESLESKS